MEDILASIKRIIAEDSEAASPRAPRVRRGPVAVPDPVDASAEPPVAVETVAVETVAPAPVAADPIAPEIVAPTVINEEPPVPAPVSEASDVLELTSPLIDPEPERMTAPAAPIPAAQPPAAQPPAAQPGSDDGAPILSGAAALASRNAFAALTQLQVRSDEGKSNTLEGLVGDLLKPMLRDWLDRELPGIVERLVQDEIKRVSGRG